MLARKSRTHACCSHTCSRAAMCMGGRECPGQPREAGERQDCFV
jgi:hypothetical protein